MAPKKKDEQQLPSFWYPNEAEGYVLGEVLHQDDSDNMHVRLQLADGSSKTSNFHASVAKPVKQRLRQRRQLKQLLLPGLIQLLKWWLRPWRRSTTRHLGKALRVVSTRPLFEALPRKKASPWPNWNKCQAQVPFESQHS